MKVLIHACPQRMWYVEEFLAPNLRSQGAEVEIWNDVQGIGNLYACMESFKRRLGDGATWHIQDDVLPCRDFVKGIDPDPLSAKGQGKAGIRAERNKGCTDCGSVLICRYSFSVHHILFIT